jgi:cellulose biosynthesis protein BcsQ
LLVDADPQCNLTSYMVDPTVVDDLLDNSDGPEGNTIWTALKQVVEGTGDVQEIEPIELPSGCYLLPGDIRLSDFEAELNEFWAQTIQRKPRGFKGTSAISLLVNRICASHEIDFVFYDCGPNVGPLNRVILLDCDFFVVAAACDQFSVRALKTLGRTLAAWIEDWITISDLAPDQAYLLPGRPHFLGYIPQRFRVYGQNIASADRKFLAELHRRTQSEVAAVLRKVDPKLAPPVSVDLRIGEVKDLHSMVPKSQEQSLPISDVKGFSEASRTAAQKIFITLAKSMVSRIERHG